MLSQQHIDTVKATIPLLASAGPAITEHFYQRMFAHNPELKHVFNMTHQRTGGQPAALFNAIAAYATHIDNLEVLTGAVMRIAHKHTSFNIQPDQYDIVGHHLIETLRELAPDAFTQDVEEAWVAAYGQLADIFIKVEGDLYAERAGQQGGWKDFRRFRVASKTPESDLVTSFVFEPVDGGAVIGYQPGQYLGVKLHPKGNEFDEIRQYSLSTTPNGKHYRISVKREGTGDIKGVMSNYLHDHLKVGDEIEAMPPAGDFVFKDKQTPVVLISGGVGLTPMQAILDTLAKQQYSHPVSYLHACAHQGQHSFKEHVNSLKGQLNLSIHTWYEQANSEEDGVLNGMMQLEAIKDSLPLTDGEFYLCGPVGFMMFVKQQLLTLGVEADRIHYELFGPHQEV
ncbi:NO-inducible flavohemoprotein [Marinomonas hwangdonensis]|uniref:Flavohemoprotein n=1 Tax=Marinomonas hwangdonensis TaxID=1053647 RepID=A0A3M8Q6B9_9GAMM|nr:NO-inducible flavohemoprotein [Marinomonas hwangdonensis]RNF51635.1 NO-inducible flavohemoprotein [Marinomonas hwangdonensis]